MTDKYPGARRAAILVTCAVVLQAAETFLPRVPLPGIRLGLANVITLIAMTELGFWGAIEVAAIRTIAASLLLGTFLSPSFFISFVSAVSSAVVMAGLYELLKKMKNPPVSLVGLSIIGAGVHNAAQLFTVYFVLIKNSAVFVIAPWLGISAVITGFITGVIASGICSSVKKLAPRLEAIKNDTRGLKIKENPDKHGIKPVYYIITAVFFAVMVFAFENMVFYAVSFAVMLLLPLIVSKNMKDMLIMLYKAKYLLLFSILTPLFFTPGGRVLFESGFVKLTVNGLNQGLYFMSRIALLMMSSWLLCAALPPKKLAEGMRVFLKPLAYLGFNAGRFSAILVSTWVNFPGFWERAVVTAKKYGLLVKAGKTGLIAAAGAVITEIIMRAEESFI